MPYVCTVDEPQRVALHGYLEGYHPPGITDPTLWQRVGRTLLAAHHAAVRAATGRLAAPG
nr:MULTISPECIES: family 1 glycosylhydrolase [unclassified Plantactinospora]